MALTENKKTCNKKKKTAATVNIDADYLFGNAL